VCLAIDYTYANNIWCRHPEDRIPPHTSSKSRQGAGRASTCCHASCNFGPHLPTSVGFEATMCPTAPDLTSLPRWALALPRVPWLWTLPPREEGSGAVTCSLAPNLTSLPRWALALPPGPGLASLRGELRCCHVPHGPQRVVDHRNKERPSCPR
jgi:hypothetical protein